MELIEDRQSDAAQFGIVLDHPRQMPSPPPPAAYSPDAGFRAHPIADGRPGFTQQLRQTPRATLWLIAAAPAGIMRPSIFAIGENLQRQPWISGTGWRVKQTCGGMLEGREKFREDGGNRQWDTNASGG